MSRKRKNLYADAGKEGRSQRAKNAGRYGSRLCRYAAEAAVIAVLLGAAFFAPRAVFQIQDRILCGNTVLGRQENMDVEALSASYERSLAKRMANYAEGLAEEENFYVTSQNLTVDDELTEWLYTEGKGVYHESLNYLVEGGLLSETFRWRDYKPVQWKKYVIYSDNYAKGVNFILWYVELQSPEGAVMKLLADAEDSTIYAVKTESNGRIEVKEGYGYDAEVYRYLRESGVAYRIWIYAALNYGALTEADAEKLYYFMEDHLRYSEGEDRVLISSGEMSVADVEEETASIAVSILTDSEGMSEGTVAYYSMGEYGLGMNLPFGDNFLNMIIDVKESKYAEEYSQYGMYVYPDVTIGIQEIYKMILEFA